MLQNFKYLFLTLFICGSAYGQALPIRNDTPTALRDLGANLNVGKNFAVDSFGQTKIGAVSPGTGATNLGKAEDTPTADGDVGVAALFEVNTAFDSKTNTTRDYGFPSIGRNGQVYSTLTIDANLPGSVSAVKNEDNPAVSQDGLVVMGGVINSSFSTPAANGDYTVPSLGTQGQMYTAITVDTNLANNGVARLEDAASGDQNGILSVGFVREDALTVNTSLSGDWTWAKTDAAGRLITAPAPAGETWSACSGVAAGTVDVAIKAAVASNRMYVTSLTCYNNSTTATTIDIDDGATSIWKAYLGTTTLGNNQYSQTFPVPLRGSVNTALNVKPSTTASGTFCCAAGYISIS